MMYSKNNSKKGFNKSRRKFISNLTAISGAQVLLSAPLISKAAQLVGNGQTYTVGNVINKFISEVSGSPLKETVDTLKSGSMDMPIKGIVTSMFATIEVIKKTISSGANFIIAHEPTFYNHPDNTTWLKDDLVYQYKYDLLKKNNITVWRNHDYIHSMVPDAVTMSVLSQLGWEKYADKNLPNLLTLPGVNLKELIFFLKQKMGIEQLRYIGDLNNVCSRILIEPGAAGVEKHIMGIKQYKPDVLICGEISEWETAEYVRDARSKGDNISLIVLGHVASEEAGSAFLLQWLKEKFPTIQSAHIPAGNSLSFL
jgi:putative NIF3 family GTP cyclohydrolase 1 type 2